MSKIKQKIDELWALAEEAKYKETCSPHDRRVLNMLQRELKKLKLQDDETIKQAVEVAKEEWKESNVTIDELDDQLFDNGNDEDN